MQEIQKFSDPITKLIESVSKAIGVLYEPNRIVRNARAESKAELIRSMTKQIENEYLRDITIRNLHKEIIRQSNIESIIENSIHCLPDNLHSNSSVDNDWLMDFFDLSQNCSNKNLQFVWGKLLANEIDKPGTISRRTLNVVKLLSSTEAKLFNKFCSCVWTIENFENYKIYAMILDSNEKGEYTETGWGFSGLDGHRLEELNLIFDDEFQISKSEYVKLIYHGVTYKIKAIKKDTWLSTLVLTETGAELFNILDIKQNMAYYNHITKYLKKKVKFKK